METKELMRFNLIKRKRDGLIVEVLEVLTTKILYVNPDLSNIKATTADLAGFEPIPLSEDILVRLGFEDCFDSQHRSRYEIIAGDKAFVFNLSKHDKGKNYFEVRGVNVEWHLVDKVHLLQNLFYALTGQELTLNLK